MSRADYISQKFSLYLPNPIVIFPDSDRRRVSSGKEMFRLWRFWAILAVLYVIVGNYKRTWFNVNFPDVVCDETYPIM